MRAIDRVRTIQAIVAAVDRIMNFDDMHAFFRAMNIEPTTDEEGYIVGRTVKDQTRAYLDNCSNANLLDIADQLDLSLSIATPGMAQLGESRYWLTDHLRVFISHVHTVKQSAAVLKQFLQQYGISCFVAHEDIETSDEWRDEILRCLISMDALVAILSEDFPSSRWTDQEVGAAICRDVLVIPLNKGIQPYGFIEKYQSFNVSGKTTARAVAEHVFQTIANNPKTAESMAECLTKLISTGTDIKAAMFRIDKLNRIDHVATHHWTTIRNNIAAHPVLSNSKQLVDRLNMALTARDLEPVTLGGDKPKPLDDEIPF